MRQALLLLLLLGLPLLAGCGGDHRSATIDQAREGIRIYDPSGRVAAEVTEADVISSSVKTWRGAGAGTNVNLELTAHGRRGFRRLTGGLAHRGAQLHRVQHFAIAVDDRVYSRPFIDYRISPDGLDATGGVEIANVPTKMAERLAAEIRRAGRN